MFNDLSKPLNFKLIIYTISVLIIGMIIGYLITFQLKQQEVNKGTICLIIDDFGFSRNKIVDDFFHINKNLSVAIIPGTPFSKSIAEYTDSLGIETIIHMPMESNDNDNTKYPISLNEKLNASIVNNRIELAFNEIPTALGMSNHQGSKATANLQLMKNIARKLKKMDKFFLDSFTNPESRGYITMRRYGVPTQLRQVFLDHIDDSIQIKHNLDSLVNLSHDMDIVIGIGHVKKITLDILKKEIPRLESEGYNFIPLSKAVR